MLDYPISLKILYHHQRRGTHLYEREAKRNMLQILRALSNFGFMGLVLEKEIVVLISVRLILILSILFIFILYSWASLKDEQNSWSQPRTRRYGRLRCFRYQKAIRDQDLTIFSPTIEH